MELKKVRMLVTRRGSHDQYRFFKYEEGKEYNLPKTLADNYLSKGVATQDPIPEPKKKKKGR